MTKVVPAFFLLERSCYMKKEKVVLIDGHNLLFRMFYGIPSSIKNKDGKEIKGVVGFIGSLKKIASQFQPFSMVVVFDSETSKNTNLKLSKDYKSNRPLFSVVPEEENPFSQLPMIKQCLDFLHISYLEVEENEADDYIASLVSQLRNKYEFIIISTDTDFFQLLDRNVHVFVPRGKHSVLYGVEEFVSKYTVFPNQYVLFKSLVGDKSDHISGVPGIGKVLAAKIVRYPSIYAYCRENKGKQICKLLEEHSLRIIMNQKLIALNKDLNIGITLFAPLSSTLFSCKTYEIIDAADKIEV